MADSTCHPFSDDDDDEDFRSASPSILAAPLGYTGPAAASGSGTNRYGASKSIEADLPLTSAAAPPAGASSYSFGDDYGQQESSPARGRRAQSSLRRPWWKKVNIKEAWQEWRAKGVDEGVPRRVTLNAEGGGGDFERNSVSTGKYNPVTFLFIFFYGQSCH